ncbi:MAG: branched-chain amino acid ABC transporter permease, partial [bacterium]
PQTTLSGLLMGLVYALISVGLSLIYGLMDIVNFAHGEYLMLGMYSAFWAWFLFNIDPLFSIPISAAVMALLGVLTYFGIIKRILTAPSLAQIFGTYGILVFLRGLAQLLWTADFRNVVDPIASGRINFFGLYLGTGKVVAAAGAAITLVIFALVLNKTKLGLSVRATASDRSAAELMGINTDKVLAIGWALGIGCTGVAGSLLVNFNYVSPQVGALFGLLSFVAVALGGFGSLTGAFIGAVAIGLFEAIGGVLFGPSYKYAVVFCLYLVAVLLRPLFARK